MVACCVSSKRHPGPVWLGLGMRLQPLARLVICPPAFCTCAGNLTSVGGKLSINHNLRLTSLAGLSSLTSVAYDVFITQNPQLTSLEDLASSLQEVCVMSV